MANLEVVDENAASRDVPAGTLTRMLRNSTRAVLLCALALGCAGTTTDDTEVDVTANSARIDQPIELGNVRWERDYAAARTHAAQTDRDLLMLFQEVPG